MGILAWERTENGRFSTPIGGRHGKEEGQEGEEEEPGEEKGSGEEEGQEEVVSFVSQFDLQLLGT